MSRIFLIVLTGLCGCDARPAGPVIKPKVVFITSGPSDFCDMVGIGAQAGANDYEAELEVLTPRDAEDQRRMVHDALSHGVAGIAIDPMDPADQVELMTDAAAKTRLVTYDSPVPQGKRLAHVGTDHYDAGRLMGKLVKDALPGGCTVVILGGSIDEETDRRRRQGVIDELMDRTHNPNHFDNLGTPIKGNKFEVVATLLDGFDRDRAKRNALDALANHERLGVMVGLFHYNAPAVFEAIGRRAGRDVHVVAFDEDDTTLQAIKDRQCHGTVVRNPYRCGYESVRILAGATRADPNALPSGGVLTIPPRAIKNKDLDEFWAEKRGRMTR